MPPRLLEMPFAGPVPSSYPPDTSSDVPPQDRLRTSLSIPGPFRSLVYNYSLVSPVTPGAGGLRTNSLWQVPEKQKGGRD